MDERIEKPAGGNQATRKNPLAFYAVCVLLLLAVDLFLEKYGHFEVEEWIGYFMRGIGFAACVVFVLAARGLRVILRRKEDYYD